MNARALSTLKSQPPAFGEHSIASQIAREFGRLHRDGKGSIAKICDDNGGAIDTFLDLGKAQIIKAILPGLWESAKGGYGVGVIGRDTRDFLWFSDDFSRWHIEGVDKHGGRSGVVSLMSFMAYGRTPDHGQLLQLLGLAAARVLIGEVVQR